MIARPLIASPVVLALAVGCGAEAAASNASQGPPRIAWDENTRTLIEKGAVYGRMIRLRTKEILCVYDLGGRIRARSGRDDGRTWGDAEPVAHYEFGVATNPEALELANGWILCSYNERPRDGVHPFRIMTCVSKDRGKTWSSPAVAYTADTRAENGCWEPAQVQLPSGEIQLFFANENPYRSSAEQEITMLRSRNNAGTWSPPRTVSFRPGKRDGMPVPLLLNRRRGVVLAIEDNGLNGKFKPVIIYTSLKNNWRQPPAGGSDSRRWRALRTPLPPGVYAGAPYVRQMPGGQTILSFQSDEGARRKPHMVVYVGDGYARNFAGRSVPFDVPPDTACLWNSLFVKGRHTVTAVSGTTIDGLAGLWAIDGRLNLSGGTDRR